MAKRTAREFAATLEQQLKQFRPVRVNPFPLMMDAARHSQAQQAASRQHSSASCINSNTTTAAAGASHAATSCTLCSHCGVGLSELQVQQCHTCKAVYCSSCSVINYDEREDRVFCLDCNVDCMQITSCDDPYDDCGQPNSIYHNNVYQHQQQQHHNHQQQHHQFDENFMFSPPGRENAGVSQAAAISAERRSSVVRACNMAAAAAAAAADSGGSCMAAMAGIGGLQQEQLTPLFAQGGMCGFGGGSTGRVQGSELRQWDLNSPPLSRLAVSHNAVATPAVFPFAAGY